MDSTRRRLIVTCFSLLIGLAPSSSAQSLGTTDFGDSSPVLDLSDKIPLRATILQTAALKIKDAILAAKYEEEINKLQSSIEPLVTDRSGYLVGVESYSDEFGTPVIPGGQLVFPVGPGIAPIDAMAKFLRKPVLKQASPTGLNNDTFYLWITREQGKLRGRIISQNVREVFEKQAADEKQRRELLSEWLRYAPEGVQSVRRSEYWGSVAKQYVNKMSSDQRKKQVTDLIQKFDQAEQQFNKAYGDFQRRMQELAAEKQNRMALECALGIAKVVTSAVEAAALSSSTNGLAAMTAGSPRVDLSKTIEIDQSLILKTETSLVEEHDQIIIKGNNLENLDSQIRTQLGDDNLDIPHSEEKLVLP